MRKSLYLYLFVFAGLLALFQYVSAEHMLESKNEEIEALKEDLAIAEKKQNSLKNNNASYFSLLGNDDAISYFEAMGLDASEIEKRIKDLIIGKNKTSQDNELVPYEGMEDFMRINKIKVLNHKWILADFTDGTYWGELFITYYLDENGDLVFDTQEAFLYPKN